VEDVDRIACRRLFRGCVLKSGVKGLLDLSQLISAHDEFAPPHFTGEL